MTDYLWPAEADAGGRVAEYRPDEETMVQAVAQQLGVAVIFRSRADYLAIPGVTYRPLQPPLHGQLSIAWRADDPSPAISAFTQIARTGR
jgi:DNA-binding transcriptional LysR family regulator